MRAARIIFGEFTGWHMLAVTLGFFGVVVAVNIFMAVSSITSWTGLVVENSYVASQEFNGKLAASRQQAALGWSARLSSDAGRVVFTLLDAEGESVAADAVAAEFSRPIGVSEDRTLAFEPRDGAFVTAEALPAGIWNVVVTAGLPGRPAYEYRARYLAPEPAP
jgi:nitrogen fixation protein FixH